MNARRRLQNRRPAETFDFSHAGQHFRATLGRYDDGSLGEIFVSAQKLGTTSDAIMRDAAILASFCLQYAAPLDALRKAMTRDGSGRPSSPIGTLLDLVGGGQ
jgi:ribonucleoside-diphosphate reductase alpha chain